jgi:hypothetical protein
MQVYFARFRDDCLRDERGLVHALIVSGSSFSFASLPYGARLRRAKWCGVALSYASRVFLGSESLIWQTAWGRPAVARLAFDEAHC